MQNSLLETALRYAESRSDRHGVARTPVPGLSLIRSTTPSTLQYAISRPLVALVLQGAKRVSMGCETIDFGAGESLLIAADVPTVSQIMHASRARPYLSVVVDLDPSTIEALVLEMTASPAVSGAAVRVEPTESEVANAALRLLHLLDQPVSLSVLQSQLMRELHFWLLSGRHGAAIRALGARGSYARRIAPAVSIIRANYAKSLRVKQLAEAAGMSLSSFHKHFRAITSLTPLQFQKQLRLIEARRMMLVERLAIASAAHAVGYESVAQFTRDYGRMFGLPPARDMKAAREKLQQAA